MKFSRARAWQKSILKWLYYIAYFKSISLIIVFYFGILSQKGINLSAYYFY